MYSALTKKYRWTTHAIRRMTPWAQLVMCNPDAKDETLYFDTEEEYLEWVTTRR